MLFSAGGVLAGTDAVPGHATGFFVPIPGNAHMTKKPMSQESPSSDNGRNNVTDQIDADPPYLAEFDSRVEQFRKLLAELIAQQMLAQQQDSRNAREQGRD